MKNETKTNKKEVRKRVNIKDLAELPARLDLVSSNMTLVALLAKKDAEKNKIFTDAQSQIAKLKATNQALVLEEARGALQLEDVKDRGVEAVKAAMSLYEDAKNKVERAENKAERMEQHARNYSIQNESLSDEICECRKAGLDTALEFEEVEFERVELLNEVRCLKADQISMGKTCASIRTHYQAREADAKITINNAHATILEYEQRAGDWRRVMVALAVAAVLIVCVGVLFS